MTKSHHVECCIKGCEGECWERLKDWSDLETWVEKKCEAGCMVFTGGDKKHVKECVFYPESITEQYDQLEEAYKKQTELLKEVKILINEQDCREDEDCDHCFIVHHMLGDY